MRKVRTLGLLGTGVIGGGWAARALHCGIDVIAADVDPKMEEWIRETVEHAMPQLQALTAGVPMPAPGKLAFTLDAAAMAAQADFIQENVPERLELKLRVLESVSKVADPDVVISSSTSGFMPSELHTGISHPERVIVGHPFNPVYLCPLVEVVGNSQTSPEVKEAAAEFYRSIGMHVLTLRREVSGHLSDRLQESMWREILHMVNDDIASTSEIDESIVYGPGLRWAIMGMSQLYMLSAGQGGVEYFFKQFGPSVDWPWSHNTAPAVTREIIDRFAKGTADQVAGKSVREQEKIRDECMVAIQRVLAKYNMGAGKTLNEFEARIRAKAAV
ncbi:3-hydroxyacyl-CoA dehydrogenase NAD-binding domain-containing protein [Mesorhizobium sp. M1348]|uniref:3-hydroxyacyl-CoA dehydrogenase NAD-binding domain-containing protein n=1 Tax=Mesorhizobium sp. M1348 TaxID=2957089 RepID=UPI00333AE679